MLDVTMIKSEMKCVKEMQVISSMNSQRKVELNKNKFFGLAKMRMN